MKAIYAIVIYGVIQYNLGYLYGRWQLRREMKSQQVKASVAVEWVNGEFSPIRSTDGITGQD